VLINESFATGKFPGREALGQRLRFGPEEGDWFTGSCTMAHGLDWIYNGGPLPTTSRSAIMGKIGPRRSRWNRRHTMDDSHRAQQPREAEEPSGELTRRDFVALSVAAGLTVAAGSRSAAELPVVETSVEIKTPDGTCDAHFIHPTSGSYPGVLIWTDAFGSRPSMRDIAKRAAAEGYAVLLPNPFYRSAKAPVFDSASSFNFQNPADMAKLQPLMASVNAPGIAERDAAAYIAFLDAQPAVNKAKKIGTQGYCMGGALVVRTAAAVPDRVGAGASFHGGGLVTVKPDSPYLLAPKIRARMYFGVASNDDMRQPDAKDKLKEAFATAKVPAEIEVYPGALHGWCVRDMPLQDGKPVYSQPDAERAWVKLMALYKTGLA
jgi:carboxymethylenebutenolidase